MTIQQLFDDIIIDYCEQGIAINSVESLVNAIEGCEDYKKQKKKKKDYVANNKYTLYIKLISHCTWTHIVSYRLNENDTINILAACDFKRRMSYRNE